MPRLIINADDLGYSPAVNRATAELYRAGRVTSASLVVNLPASEAGAQVAAGLPGLSIGVHLNLSKGRPLLPAQRVPSLVDPEGRFWHTNVLYPRALLGQVNWEEAEAELETQVAWALDRLPRLDNLDTHVHFHMLPPARRITRRLAQRFGVPAWRTPDPRSTLLPSRLWNELLAVPTAADGRLLAPNYLISLHQWQERLMSDERLAHMLAQPGVVTELVVHPGYADDPDLPLPDQLPPARRQAELDLLLGPEFSQWVDRLGFGLVGFSDLSLPQRQAH